jgi:hypothetical protein
MLLVCFSLALQLAAYRQPQRQQSRQPLGVIAHLFIVLVVELGLLVESHQLLVLPLFLQQHCLVQFRNFKFFLHYQAHHCFKESGHFCEVVTGGSPPLEALHCLVPLTTLRPVPSGQFLQVDVDVFEIAGVGMEWMIGVLVEAVSF